jgi:hypothetical protein
MRNIAFALLLVGGAAHADNAFTVTVETPAAKKAQKGTARIKIAPGAGFHMNKDYPTSVSVVAPTGVTVEKPKQSKAEAVRFEETGAEFEVAYTASDAGKKTFSGELKFAVCSANSCDPKRAPLSFTVDVK